VSSAVFYRLRNWLADSIRFLPASLYWNSRKAIYRWRGRRGRCPCQSPSDDNIAGRIGCEAKANWHDPVRFRKICPLLVRTPEGWRCSVAAEGVRPFWGRLICRTGLALAAGYLAGALVALAALRWIGHAPVRWGQVAWPGKWHEIRQVQSAALFGQAIEAFRRGRLNDALVVLSSARTRDPNNYEAALLLGQIAMFQGSVSYADELFAELMRQYPARLERTAITYHDTLLALGRFNQLAAHSLAMVQADPSHAALWVRSVLLGLQQGRRDADFGAQHAGEIAALAPHARFLVRAELDIQAGRRAEAVAALKRPFAGPYNLIYMQQQVEGLARLGETDAAQVLLDFYGPMMGGFEHAALQYVLDSCFGDAQLARADFTRALNNIGEPERVERLLVRLIEHPSAERFRELHARLLAIPAWQANVDGPSLWITALVCGAAPESDYWRTHGRQLSGETCPPITRLDLRSRSLTDENALPYLINAVTLPREIVLALLARLPPPEAKAR
jgi:tetratricopeptide (TPR) repeat protein